MKEYEVHKESWRTWNNAPQNQKFIYSTELLIFFYLCSAPIQSTPRTVPPLPQLDAAPARLRGIGACVPQHRPRACPRLQQWLQQLCLVALPMENLQGYLYHGLRLVHQRRQVLRSHFSVLTTAAQYWFSPGSERCTTTGHELVRDTTGERLKRHGFNAWFKHKQQKKEAIWKEKCTFRKMEVVSKQWK